MSNLLQLRLAPLSSRRSTQIIAISSYSMRAYLYKLWPAAKRAITDGCNGASPLISVI
ncbi:MAG: hypothetical protein K0M60_05860 [Hydrogenophaga sp.]|nr:hypothetical protein [Hydrogenophaga sp.]